MQSKTQSMVEAWVSTGFGFLVSLAVWAWLVNPLFGFKTSTREGLAVTLIFTAVSIVRGYWTRRVFNWWHTRGKIV